MDRWSGLKERPTTAGQRKKCDYRLRRGEGTGTNDKARTFEGRGGCKGDGGGGLSGWIEVGDKNARNRRLRCSWRCLNR